MVDNPELEGLTGTLVQEKTGGRWVVDVEDEKRKARRLRWRWLLKEKNLEPTTLPAMQHYLASDAPTEQYYIVGTWTQWKPRRMAR